MKRLILVLALCFIGTQASAVGECIWPNCGMSPFTQAWTVFDTGVGTGECLPTYTTAAAGATRACSSVDTFSRVSKNEHITFRKICVIITNSTAGTVDVCTAKINYGIKVPTDGTVSEKISFGTGTDFDGVDPVESGCIDVTPTTVEDMGAYSIMVEDDAGGTCVNIKGSITVEGSRWVD